MTEEMDGEALRMVKIRVNFQLIFSFKTVAYVGFVFFGVFDISCSNFSWNFVSSFFSLSTLPGTGG